MRTAPTSPPLSQQRTNQLTIFYAGTVNVYNDVPNDKANAIMLLAGSGNPLRVSSSTEGDREGLPVQSNSPSTSSMHTNESYRIVSGANNTNAFSANIGEISALTSTSASDVKSIIPTPTPSSNMPGTTEPRLQRTPMGVQRELPYARKASLARFLEKRKDRVQHTEEASLNDGKGDTTRDESCASQKRPCLTGSSSAAQK
ncbi:hypothetical protein KP509_18G064600 [Ceratopteris richardii]|nr:hypothetical protein KP509_18G064600 [Ceratopteris richardii]